MALIETLPYEIIKEEGNIQVRAYNDFLLASTTTPQNQQQNSGFNNVFNYISGQNQSKEKISMTTPVVTYEEEDKLITGFYVPSKYDKSSVPKPSSENVFINEMSASTFAVIKFKGRWKEENYQKYDQRLKDYIKANNLKVISKRYVLRYSPPIVPGIFRRNELAYQVEEQ